MISTAVRDCQGRLRGSATPGRPSAAGLARHRARCRAELRHPPKFEGRPRKIEGPRPEILDPH